MSSQPLRPVAMDPLHITEFASDRYFEKLSQQKQQQQQQQQQQVQGQNSQQPGGNAVAGTSSIPPVPPIPAQYSQSPFILPVGRSKPVEVDESAQAVPEPKHKKSRFGLRSLRLHHKSQQTTTATSTATTAATAPILEIQEPRRSSVGDELVFRPKILPLDALFLALPIELQIQVIASLPLRDILNLRLTSKVWHATVTMNEGPIVRYHLDHHIPAYAKRLYPHDNANLNFHYLCGLWHRLHVAAKLSFFICEWVTKEIFLRTTDAQKLEFAPQKERMRRRLVPLLFTIFHFFETYRARHVQYIRDHHGRGLQQTPYTLNPIELEVMNMYDDRTLLQVHQVFPLVIASFCRRLRPPSYVGRVERSLRGYLREKPADEVHVAALCVGGLRQVERFWEIKGYNTRRGAVDVWYNSVATEPLDPVSKPRRGLMGLGRKKSTVALKEAASAQGDGSTIRRGSVDSHQDGRSGLIFNTSLAAGMPMGTLSRDELRQLMPDLPVLQQLWTVTAEALILDRKIVERSIDIKRNAQVMLELIREEGIEEEDEWWYGQGANDSVRPPLDSIEEDPIEEGP